MYHYICEDGIVYMCITDDVSNVLYNHVALVKAQHCHHLVYIIEALLHVHVHIHYCTIDARDYSTPQHVFSHTVYTLQPLRVHMYMCSLHHLQLYIYS